MKEIPIEIEKTFGGDVYKKICPYGSTAMVGDNDCTNKCSYFDHSSTRADYIVCSYEKDNPDVKIVPLEKISIYDQSGTTFAGKCPYSLKSINPDTPNKIIYLGSNECIECPFYRGPGYDSVEILCAYKGLNNASERN